MIVWFIRNLCVGMGLILTVLVNLEYGSCSNILLLPFAFRSHVDEITAIGSGLQNKGHRVFLVLPDSYPHLDELKDKYDLVVYAAKRPDFHSNKNKTNDWMMTVKSVTPIEELRLNVHAFIELCTNPLEDEALTEQLIKLQLDLAIVDGFPGSRCLYAIAYKLGIPYVTVTTQYEPWLWRNPALPSFVPFPLAGIFTERMTFAERIQSAITLVDWTAWPRMLYVDDRFLRKFLPDNPEVTYSWLTAKSLLWLIDTDVAIDYPRPTMANEVNIGGLSTGPARALLADLETFANGTSKGFIIVSFGSSAVLDDEKSFKILVSTFARLEERVFWKYSNDIPAIWSSKIPANVRIMKWLPQNDLLGHRSCKLFVTHCGSNSQFEALYHGVPMLGMPVFADQLYNARRMEYLGYGRFIEHRTVTSEVLFHSIRETISNVSYLENIRRGSKIFKSRPQTPQERAVWWVEHVLCHGGRHLHSIALDMPWYEYLMLDMLLVLVILPVVIATSALSFCFTYIVMKRGSAHIKLKSA